MSQRYLTDDNNRQGKVEREKSREWEGQKNIFTSLHSRSLSPGGVVYEGLGCFIDCLAAGGERRGGMEDQTVQSPETVIIQQELLPLLALSAQVAGGFQPAWLMWVRDWTLQNQVINASMLYM